MARPALVFNGVGLIVVFLFQILQAYLPLNPALHLRERQLALGHQHGR